MPLRIESSTKFIYIFLIFTRIFDLENGAKIKEFVPPRQSIIGSVYNTNNTIVIAVDTTFRIYDRNFNEKVFDTGRSMKTCALSCDDENIYVLLGGKSYVYSIETGGKNKGVFKS